MAELTSQQALKQARDLKTEFNSHGLLKNHRAILGRTRAMQDVLAAIGITSATLQNKIPWESEVPNQEAHLFATALSLAAAEVQTFAGSDQISKVELVEELERAYDGAIQLLIPNDYDIMRDVSSVGFAVRRLDEDGRWYSGRPKREKGQETEDYLREQDEHAQNMRLPFRIVQVPPDGFYYLENDTRKEVIFGAEYTEGVRESQVKENGEFNNRGTFIAIRSRDTIYHYFSKEGSDEGGELIWDGPNRFLGGEAGPHTGYFLYRGRYTGSPNPEQRYDPYVLVSLNAAQPIGLFMTLRAAIMVQEATYHIEHDLPRAGDGLTAAGRAINLERKAGTQGAQVRTDGGAPAAEFEPGAHVVYRQVVGDISEYLGQLLSEVDQYRFKDILMGEAASDASGRAIIRLQEAAGRQLAPGYRERKLRTEEILRVIRGTVFGRTEYLKDAAEGQRIYIPQVVEGGGDEGDENREELLAISSKHDIPHEIRVRVEARSDAAQLAWMEEGRAMKGELSSDSIMGDFYGVKDTPLERRRLAKDAMREIVYPATVQHYADMAIQDIQATEPANRPIVLPNESIPGMNGAGPAGMTQASISGQPTPSQPEDVGMTIAGEGGVSPLGV